MLSGAAQYVPLCTARTAMFLSSSATARKKKQQQSCGLSPMDIVGFSVIVLPLKRLGGKAASRGLSAGWGGRAS